MSNQIKAALAVIVLFIGLLTAFSRQADAAEISVWSLSSTLREIVIEGSIEAGDFTTFINLVKDNQAQINGVYIFSPGGDFEEAMKIGRAMRSLELSSMVPQRSASGRPMCETSQFLPEPTPANPQNCTCASACFFIHIGSIQRGGDFLAVHRPYFAKGKFGELPEADATKLFNELQDNARNYMIEMGVPEHVREDVLGTSSDNALILDDKTVKTYFWGALPARHEWVRNKCSQLSDAETERLDDYQREQNSGVKLPPSAATDFSSLVDKEMAEVHCGALLERQSHVIAYEKYFGVKPSDYAKHDFVKWVNAPKYLQRQFDEVKNEEKFVEKDDPRLGNSLWAEETAAAPAVLLLDSSPVRIVSEVDLIKAAPSEEFISRVIKTLTNAWGEPKLSQNPKDSLTEYHWVNDKEEFYAELKHEPKSAEGGYLSLKILRL